MIIQDHLEFLKNVFENHMPVNRFMGIKVVDIKEGYVKIHMPFKEEFIGDFIQKRWHGGMQASLADTAGGLAAMTTVSSIAEKVSTIDMRLDFLNASEPKDLYAEAEVLKIGKRIIKVDVKLYHQKNTIIALARCGFSVLRTD
ncbi:MAG: PaaI family thioesterase [Flavobacteriaceae bacterium]|nr:PaaI family thioesterase [Flavobacteriaceae bacterium]